MNVLLKVNSLNITFPVFSCEIPITVAKTAFYVLNFFCAVFLGRKNNLANFLELQQKNDFWTLLKTFRSRWSNNFSFVHSLEELFEDSASEKKCSNFQTTKSFFFGPSGNIFSKGFLKLLFVSPED